MPRATSVPWTSWSKTNCDRSEQVRVGSLFSGIGGMDLGLARAGFEHVFFCEADPYRRRVLSRHWPGVPIYEDVRDVGFKPELRIDLLAGGFPCQDLSIAGKRKGLAGERSGLFFEFARIADELVRPGGWILVENVPGLLSSNEGRDMGVVVATLADLGFLDLAYRVLDSRYFGVPQRRRRVFILARRARGQRAVQVLLEPESGGGDFEASREARKGSAASFGVGLAGTLGAKKGGGVRYDLDSHGAYVAGTAKTLTAGVRWDFETEDFIAAPAVAAPLTKGSAAGRGVSYPGRRREDDYNLVCPPSHPNGVRTPPRAPGHVDDPDWPNPRPDGPRYAACGDAVTVNVAEWIGRRLMERA